MNTEIQRIFNNKCLCFGIEFHWNAFLGVEIHFLWYNITIIFKEGSFESLQKIKTYRVHKKLKHVRRLP